MTVWGSAPGVGSWLRPVLVVVTAAALAWPLAESGAGPGSSWAVALLSLAALLSGVQGVRTD